MNLKEALRRAWRYLEAFGYALDYDPLADIASRVQRLESDSQSKETRLAVGNAGPEERAMRVYDRTNSQHGAHRHG